MSFYDDASLVFLAGGAAGKDGKAYNLKPVEELSSTEVVINGDFSIDGPGADGELDTSYGNYGWNTVTPSAGTQEGTTTISNGVLKLTNALGETDSRAYATDGVSSRNVITTNTYYKLVYTIVENNGCTSFKVYNAGGVQEDAPSSVGTHTVTLRNTSNQLFLFFNKTESSSISIDNVSIREITNQAADFTFTRGTNLTATRVGKDGYIEKGRENLLLQSNQFDTTWFNNGTTETSGQTGYDGSSNAWLLEKTVAGGSIRQSIVFNGVGTYSVYAKAGTKDWLRLVVLGSPSNRARYFDLANGTTGSSVYSTEIDSTITSVGGGWYRCTITTSISITEVRIYPADGDGINTATSGNIYIQDAQLEQGLVATDYIETGATTATAGLLEDEPRFDYTGGGCPALLLEPTRTNEVPNSEGVVENDSQVTLTVNHGIAPDGTKSSLKVAKYGTNSNDRIQPISNDNVTLTNSSEYSISAFVKNIDCTGVTTLACRTDAGSNELFRQGFQWTGASLALTSSQESGTRTGAFVESYGNDWWRIGFTFTANSTAGDFELDIDRANGTATTSIETWGWQLEEGAFATSYIPTYGSSATRAKEYNECSFSGIGSQGTVFGEVEIKDDGVYGTPVALSDGDSTTNFILVYKQGDNKLSYRIRTGGVDQTSIASAVLAEGYHKFAFRFKENDCDFFVNGEIVDSDTSATMPTGLDSIRQYIGTDTNKFHGGTKQLLYFPTVLSNNDTEILTGATSYRSFNVMRSARNYTAYE